MASLIENLMDTLNRESDEYETLVELSMKKTPVVIRGDLEALQAITDEEQLAAARINHIEKERRDVMKEIAGVLNTDVEALKLADMIRILERRPAEQKKMEECQNRLKAIVYRMKQINEHNLELIEKALEMTQFELNLYHSMKSAPETANYNKAAYNDGSVIGTSRGRFDAKQ